MSLVSVIMPVYNAGLYLEQSIESILSQTLKNFEFIIINDGSTDNTADILERYAIRDSRIRVYSQENQGVTSSLNRAVSLANSLLIARMDADDVSARNRLQEQFDFLEKHSDYVLVGTDYTVIDANNNMIKKNQVPNKDTDLRIMMYVNSPLAHGSVMYRKSTFKELGGYSREAGSAEDYDLWSRMMEVGKIYIIPRILFKWRLSDKNITTVKASAVAHSASVVRARLNKSTPVLFDLDTINSKVSEYNRGRYLVLLDNYSRLCIYQIRNRLPYGLKNLSTLCKSQPYGRKIFINRMVEIISRGKKSLNYVTTK